MPRPVEHDYNPKETWQPERPLEYVKWYFRRHLEDERVQRMSWAAQGLYTWLLFKQPIAGSLPSDPQRLVMLCPGKTLEEFLQVWPEIQTADDPLFVRCDVKNEPRLKSIPMELACREVGRKSVLAASAGRASAAARPNKIAHANARSTAVERPLNSRSIRASKSKSLSASQSLSLNPEALPQPQNAPPPGPPRTEHLQTDIDNPDPQPSAAALFGKRLAELRTHRSGFSRTSRESIRFYAALCHRLMSTGDQISSAQLEIIVWWFEHTADGKKEWSWRMAEQEHPHVLEQRLAVYSMRATTAHELVTGARNAAGAPVLEMVSSPATANPGSANLPIGGFDLTHDPEITAWWQAAIAHLRASIDQVTIDTWLAPCSAGILPATTTGDPQTIAIIAPSPFFRNWLRSNLRTQIIEALNATFRTISPTIKLALDDLRILVAPDLTQEATQ